MANDRIEKGGMDGGVTPTVISSEQLSANRQQDIDTYNAKIKDLASQVLVLSYRRDQLNSDIVARNKDLDDVAVKKMADLKSQSQSFISTIAQQTAMSMALNQEIKDKQNKRDSISLDFSNQKKEIIDGQERLAQGARDLAAAQAQLDLEKINLVSRETAVAGLMARESQLNARELIIVSKEQENEANAQKNLDNAEHASYQNKIIADKIDQLNLQKQQLDKQLADAAPILAQAEAILKQKADNEIVPLILVPY